MMTQQQRGFTLIEALVALLVLSIGLLGVASMQLKALQSAHAGYQRSIASLAAQDAQERLWAEMAKEDGLVCPDEAGVNGTGEGTWYAQWSPFLPGLDFNPVGEPSVGCEFTITVEWDEERFEGGDPFTYTVRLPGSTS